MTYLNMRIYRISSIKNALKITVGAAILFQLVTFCYIRLTRDWCSEGHDLCCRATTTQFDSQLARFFSQNKSDVIEVVNKEYDNYLINPKTMCADNDVFLLIIVTSAPGNDELRHAIRHTWGSYARESGTTVRLAFLIGSSSNDSVQYLIKKEGLTNRDIIQAGFLDSYRNLTLKSMSLLYWATHNCIKAKHVMKADDDVFVHIPNLIRLLQQFKDKTRTLLGAVGRSEKPHRTVNDKWYVDPIVYPFPYFPVFVHGPAYVISGDLVAVLLRMSTKLKPLWLEDVFITGICAQAAGVTYIGNCGFRTGRRGDEDWIVGSYPITGHEYSPLNMLTLWNKLHTWGLYSFFISLGGKIMGS